MAEPRYHADPDRPGAIYGPEANDGDGGTIAYVCEPLGPDAACDRTCTGEHHRGCPQGKAQHELATRIAGGMNELDAVDAGIGRPFRFSFDDVEVLRHEIEMYRDAVKDNGPRTADGRSFGRTAKALSRIHAEAVRLLEAPDGEEE